MKTTPALGLGAAAIGTALLASASLAAAHDVDSPTIDLKSYSASRCFKETSQPGTLERSEVGARVSGWTMATTRLLCPLVRDVWNIADSAEATFVVTDDHATSDITCALSAYSQGGAFLRWTAAMSPANRDSSVPVTFSTGRLSTRNSDEMYLIECTLPQSNSTTNAATINGYRITERT